MADNTGINELVSRAFTSRNATHLEHWKTKSYAQHMALGDFYDSIVDQVDGIVEAYQGNFGIVGIQLKNMAISKNIINQLKGDVAWIASNRSQIANKVSAIENMLDSLCELYLTTIYKLTNLS